MQLDNFTENAPDISPCVSNWHLPLNENIKTFFDHFMQSFYNKSVAFVWMKARWHNATSYKSTPMVAQLTDTHKCHLGPEEDFMFKNYFSRVNHYFNNIINMKSIRHNLRGNVHSIQYVPLADIQYPWPEHHVQSKISGQLHVIWGNKFPFSMQARFSVWENF